MTGTIAPPRQAVKIESRFFYFHMMLACAAIAFLGFLPSYWLPMAQGSLVKTRTAHLHGMLYFGWSLYILYQSWLGATGRIVRHRAMGLIGVSLATAMVIFGVLITVQTMRETAADNHPEIGVNVALVALTNLGLFAGIILFALANSGKPESHKRLMVMAAISLLQAPVARWFISYLHMPHPPKGSEWAVLLLALVPAVHDWRMRGRVHAAYWAPITAMAVVFLARIPLGQTAAWRGIALWIAGSAG